VSDILNAITRKPGGLDDLGKSAAAAKIAELQRNEAERMRGKVTGILFGNDMKSCAYASQLGLDRTTGVPAADPAYMVLSENCIVKIECVRFVNMPLVVFVADEPSWWGRRDEIANKFSSTGVMA
jgi:hypothetical protein